MILKEIDEGVARSLVPHREAAGNKGSFGKTLLLVGSDKYRGAMLLCLESALRGGAGYTFLCSEKGLIDLALVKFPEAIYKEISPFDSMNDGEACEISELSESFGSVAIGCGCGVSLGLFSLVSSLMKTGGGPLVIDADAINSIAAYAPDKAALFKEAKRPIILTPHPLELSRLTGLSPDEINGSRKETAERIAREYGVILLLKGNRTVITDGETTYVNTSGSSALAKGGSGDCLAGLIASLLAKGDNDALGICALSAYLHGKAGDTLALEYSDFGVTPSDLPKAMAKELSNLCKLK